MANAVGSVRYLEWEKRFERYAQSQWTVQPFCEWEGVSPATFYNWRKTVAAGNVAERVMHRSPSGTSKFPETKSQIDWSPISRQPPATNRHAPPTANHQPKTTNRKQPTENNPRPLIILREFHNTPGTGA